MKKIFSITALALATAFAGCDETKRVTDTPVSGVEEHHANLTDVYWSLTEVNGKPVVIAPDDKLVFITFHSKDNSITGNGGCNSMFGKFEQGSNDRLKITAGATKMACAGNRMEIENNFFRALAMTDSYFIKGDTLQLFKAKMAPLAKLEAKYFPR